MYFQRFQTLQRAFSNIEKSNKLYNIAKEEVVHFESQLTFLTNLREGLRSFDLALTGKESEWRNATLSIIEAEIVKELSYVFPNDGYNVKISSFVSRGKIHIEAFVNSVFSGDMPGRIRGTQGRVFQQIVSFAALVSVMSLLGIKTIYIDEAFSGSSKRNVLKLNALLDYVRASGFNVIMIVQDTSIAEGLDANRLFLSRSIANDTVVSFMGS